ncbi:MAG TPA: type II toxin-antitoxin system VapB family antitoxin [Rhizomicrobium sp.]|nr:type II toxin-antitoxin system VapB family antitoxin [Rhizomicrobium sp.]
MDVSSMGALNIKDMRVAQKARRLARLKGTSITAAVSDALDESLRHADTKSTVARQAREREVDAIVKRFKAGLKKGAPSPAKIMREMYDERGLPR